MAACSLTTGRCDLNEILTAISHNTPVDGRKKTVETVQLGVHAGTLTPLETLFLMERVTQALATNTSAKTLDLTGRTLGLSAADGIEKILLSNRTLTTLNVSGNDLGEAGAEAIARGLENNSSLTALDLRDPTLGVAGLVALQHGLEQNSTLRKLTLASTQEFVKVLRGVVEEAKTSAEGSQSPRGARSPRAERGISAEQSEGIQAALVQIRRRIVENENSFEGQALSQKERDFRELVKPVYHGLRPHVKAKVEFQIWKNFECPNGDPRFGSNNVFTSWSIFRASMRGQEIHMPIAIKAYYMNPEHPLATDQLAELIEWAQSIFP